MTEMLFEGGRIWGHPNADAVLVRSGRIAAIGRADELTPEGAERVLLRGRLVLPGFVDGHTHLMDSGLTECGWQVDLALCTREEARDRLAAAARGRATGDWLFATGWDESLWTPHRHLERRELDDLASGVAIAAVRVDGHLAVLSTKALDCARTALATRPDLVDVGSGEVREGAVDAVRQLTRPDATTLGEAMRAATAVCHRLGITTAHVMSGFDDPLGIMASAQALALRMVVHPRAGCLDELTRSGVRTGDGDEWARWGGVKLFADGSVGARNAAFSTPYLSGGKGALNHTMDSLGRLLAAADRSGWQTLVHAIGDRAIEEVLCAHRLAGTDQGLRHRVEHYEFPTPTQIDETRRLGLSVCMQPNFIGNWSGPGSLYETALGVARDRASNPIRAVLDAGVPVGFGSDGMPLSPLFGIASTVHAPYAGQRATRQEAVDGYTLGSAALFSGALGTGELAVAGHADIVVLDGELDAENIDTRRVVQTWVGGTCVHEEREDR